MRKGRDLLGLPVFEVGSEQRLGEIQDLIWDPNQQVISGLLLDKGNWFHSAKQISLAEVQHVESESIKVTKVITDCSAADRYVSKLQGKKVRTAQGKELGTVQDILLDDNCQQIIGYEISDGFISDLVSGRATIHRPNVLSQEDSGYIVVEDKLENIWETQS